MNKLRTLSWLFTLKNLCWVKFLLSTREKGVTREAKAVQVMAKWKAKNVAGS